MYFNVFAWISIVLALAYALLMLLYRFGWSRQAVFTRPVGFQPRTRISVLIPARNEALNIGECLQSVLQNHYPDTLLEIIVIDDHSTDQTADVVYQFAARTRQPLRLLSLAALLPGTSETVAYKKKAITLAVEHARGELIVCTDADCVVPPDWLWLFAAAYEKDQPAAIAGPVLIHREKTGLQFFQSLDTAGMMLITGAGIQLGWQHMGNGANLAYPKKVFLDVQGFQGNEDRASGDDMFLLHKIARQYPGKIRFLKHPEAAVQTLAPSRWIDFYRQRLRWGSKTTALPEWPTKVALAIVFGLCCCILLSMIGSVLFFGWKQLALCIGLLGIKAISDYYLLRTACRFFKRDALMTHFRTSFIMHTLYIPIVGLIGLFVKKYTWKGRNVQ
ncbi:MAG: glycosyltransferase [Lewinellaceae bacterium]|nr:glycosyltransferase [Lewinellaceae bacterium]